MPSYNIDHLVWGCADLQQGQAYFTEQLQQAPLYGGHHPGKATQNALLSLGARQYLEVLAPDRQQPLLKNLGEQLSQLRSPGIFHWCVAHADLVALDQKAQRAGMLTSGVVSQSRQTADGAVLSWCLLFLWDHDQGALLPFFIDWGDTSHPSASIPRAGALESFSLKSPQPEKLQAIFESLEMDFPIEHAAVPAIEAVIKSGDRKVLLTSLNPLGEGIRFFVPE